MSSRHYRWYLDMPNDFPRDRGPRNDTNDSISATGAPSNYQLALLKIIESVANDPRHLRKIVYELARMNLKRETWQRTPPLSASEVKECMLALETAIARVEADSSRGELGG